jgi:hypothetical protein
VATDCIPCHFEYEEKVVLPHLSLFWQQWLLREHERIRLGGYLAADVIAHAEEEVIVFQGCRVPAPILAAVEDDHRRFHPVLQRCAHYGMRAPTSAIA